MKRYFLSILCSLLMVLVGKAQVPDAYPSIAGFSATFVNGQGEEEEIGEEGGVYDAPLTVTFDVSLSDTTGFDVLYTWSIKQIKEGREVELAKRNEATTAFTFKEGGNDVSYSVDLEITCRYRANEIYTSELLGEYPFTFSLRGSSVQLFNAFSPNGDGTNDVYRVKTQSLLSFRMKIFNRWGQEVASGDHNSLPTEHENDFTYYVCWDGTYHGSRVEDGVHFILVEAEGSDGIKYVRRGDINILTGLRKEGQK